MTITSGIYDKLLAGDVATVMFVGPLASPKIVEIISAVGSFDGLWFDQEHTALTQERIEALVRACRGSGLDSFVRIPPTDYVTVMRPLEAGASGIMVAQIRSAAQVEQVVQWSKYPPLGIRGLFSGNFEAKFGTVDVARHIVDANAQRWTAIQIETCEALDCVSEIAAVPGADVLFVGTGDLACTMGIVGQFTHPRSIEALERVAKAAAKAKKPWGALVRNPDHAKICRDLGCQLFSITSDYSALSLGLKHVHKTYLDVLGD